jgi:predicted RNA binding protein YcfA (HicA-like mRNA interferase family)
MPKLPRLSGLKLIQILKQFGFVRARQKGSHVILKRQVAGREIGCVVPLHNELASGTLRGILKQARIEIKEFLSVL